MMRADLFQDRKGVHVKLDKAVHAALRSKMFFYDLSMQQVLEEFAKLVAVGDHRATKIVENLVMRNLQHSIDGRPKKQRDHRVDELDHDALYNLIEEGEQDHEPG